MHRHKCSCSLVDLLSSSLVYFKDNPEYLTRRTAMVFISLMKFQWYDFVSSSFFFVLLRRYFLTFFFHICLLDGVLFHYSQVLVSFLFSECFDCSKFSCSIPSITYRFAFLSINITHLSMLNSMPISCQYILITCIWVSNFFHFWQMA